MTDEEKEVLRRAIDMIESGACLPGNALTVACNGRMNLFNKLMDAEGYPDRNWDKTGRIISLLRVYFS